MANPFTSAMKKVLKIVIKEKDYLEKNPKVLAKLMAEYDDIHYASRFHKNEKMHDWDNPKYAVIDLEEVTTKSYAHLIYDAWTANCDKEEAEEGHELEYKPNKTMDEYVEMCTSPKYIYHSIFPNRKQVLNHFLCTIGTGIKWNKDGFLADTGPSGEDMTKYKGFSKIDFPEHIKVQCTWLENEEINLYRKVRSDKDQERKRKEKEQMDKMLEQMNKVKEILKSKVLDDSPELDKIKKVSEELDRMENVFKVPDDHPFYPICDYSPITHFPENAHISYLKAGKEICESILSNPKESASNKKQATNILKDLAKRGV